MFLVPSGSVARTAAKVGLVATVAMAGLIAASAPALADDTTLPSLKAAVTARIDLRLAALAKDTVEINAAKHLSAADKSTLTGLISQDTAGLNSLKTKVAGETTAAGIKADATSMVDDYRIFILVGPKVRLSIAGDAEAAGLNGLQAAHDKLAGLVAKAKAAGTDTTAAEADLAAMAAAITKAQGENSGQVAAVLGIQPGPDGAGIRAKVTTVRQSLGAARADMKTAVAAGRRVTAFLKGLKKTA
jgi:hypothetical protein